MPIELSPASAQALADAPIGEQVAALEHAVYQNASVRTVLERTPELRLPSWYLGAGCIAQTVWNLLHGYEPTRGIKDYDLVYFDASDLTAASEQQVESMATELFSDLDIKLDVTNEARVHLWYTERFGQSISPYRSTEHAVSTWPTTASSIGVRADEAGFVVCAPYGFSDLYALIVRPNKAIIDQSVYETKSQRWRQIWPGLSVMPW